MVLDGVPTTNIITADLGKMRWLGWDILLGKINPTVFDKSEISTLENNSRESVIGARVTHSLKLRSSSDECDVLA